MQVLTVLRVVGLLNRAVCGWAADPKSGVSASAAARLSSLLVVFWWVLVGLYWGLCLALPGGPRLTVVLVVRGD